MLDQQTVVVFNHGLKTLEQIHDFASMKDTITKMISLVTVSDLHYARDAIAKVIRGKQVTEFTRFKDNKQALAALDRKYQDLYVVLRYAKTKDVLNPKPVPDQQVNQPKTTQPAVGVDKQDKKTSTTPQSSQSPQNTQTQQTQQTQQSQQSQLANSKPPTQMISAQLGSTAQANLGNLLLSWAKSNQNMIVGTALAGSLGGAYYLYKYLSVEDKKPEEGTFERTLRSIQKYKAFSQIMKNPDITAWEEALSGKPLVIKKKKPEKKDEKPDKTIEWDSEERSLMKDLDTAFMALGEKPTLEFKLPQLPPPKVIDPSEIIPQKKVEKSETLKKEPVQVTPITTLSLLPLKKVVPKSKKEAKETVAKVIKEPKVSKDTLPENKERLVPVIRRTRRIKKITAG